MKTMQQLRQEIHDEKMVLRNEINRLKWTWQYWWAYILLKFVVAGIIDFNTMKKLVFVAPCGPNEKNVAKALKYPNKYLL